MGVLTELPSYRICTDKGRFDINPAFDVVLEVQRLYKEESLTDYEKIQQALSMLIRNRWNLRLLKPVEQLKLMLLTRHLHCKTQGLKFGTNKDRQTEEGMCCSEQYRLQTTPVI